jgi:hypothetical protein
VLAYTGAILVLRAPSAARMHRCETHAHQETGLRGRAEPARQATAQQLRPLSCAHWVARVGCQLTPAACMHTQIAALLGK